MNYEYDSLTRTTTTILLFISREQTSFFCELFSLSWCTGSHLLNIRSFPYSVYSIVFIAFYRASNATLILHGRLAASRTSASFFSQRATCSSNRTNFCPNKPRGTRREMTLFVADDYRCRLPICPSTVQKESVKGFFQWLFIKRDRDIFPAVKPPVFVRKPRKNNLFASASVVERFRLSTKRPFLSIFFLCPPNDRIKWLIVLSSFLCVTGT